MFPFAATPRASDATEPSFDSDLRKRQRRKQEGERRRRRYYCQHQHHHQHQQDQQKYSPLDYSLDNDAEEKNERVEEHSDRPKSQSQTTQSNINSNNNSQRLLRPQHQHQRHHQQEHQQLAHCDKDNNNDTTVSNKMTWLCQNHDRKHTTTRKLHKELRGLSRRISFCLSLLLTMALHSSKTCSAQAFQPQRTAQTHRIGPTVSVPNTQNMARIRPSPTQATTTRTTRIFLHQSAQLPRIHSQQQDLNKNEKSCNTETAVSSQNIHKWRPFQRIRQWPSRLFTAAPNVQSWSTSACASASTRTSTRKHFHHSRLRTGGKQSSHLFTTRPRGRAATSTTRLQMVLTTPESIIEQASTVKLLDDLIDESVRTSARRPIMRQFDPSSLWKRWKGTIFSETWDSCISKMAYAMICMIFFHRILSPVGAQGLRSLLQGFDVLWGQMLQVTTFTLTFFLNQSYALWRQCYALSRRLQGRLHDINMSLAAHAARKPPTTPDGTGSTCTAASRQVLELISRYARLFNLLTYASFTRSHRPILTPRGMRRLVERGLLTSAEREVLVNVELPATQRHNVILLWMARTFIEASRAGHFEGGAGFENQILDKFHVCRAQYGAIGDELSGRMPLAYAHIVQVLVDVVLWMYPLMAVASGKLSPVLAVLGTGILTISYQGLFDLAKQFLDPYDNESFGKGEDPLVVDTLIAETNAGSVRWWSGAAEFPISPQRIVDGELSEFLLPVRGISVDELEQMKLEQKERERELQERREKEEQERRLAEEKARALQAAADAMIPALWQEHDGEFYHELDKIPTSYIMLNGDASGVNGQHHPDATLELTEEEFFDVEPPSDDEDASLPVNGDLPIEENALFNFNLDDQEDKFPLEGLGTGVADIVNRLDDYIAGGIPLSLVPVGTAAAKLERIQHEQASEINGTEEGELGDESAVDSQTQEETGYDASHMADKNDSESLTEEEDVGLELDETSESDMLGEDQGAAIENENDDEDNWENDVDNYVHTFDFSSVEGIYKELPWFDDVDADGKEIRLSQILADEEWEEEREAAREKEQASSGVTTFEQYTKRIEEIRDATNAELTQTQEILDAAPGAESTPLSQGGGLAAETVQLEPMYDQSKLDGISQLWGLPPGELSDEFSYREPSFDDEEEDFAFDGLMQLAGQGVGPIDSSSGSATTPISAWNPNAYNEEMNGKEEEDDDDDEFAGLANLWGIGSSLDDSWTDLSGQEENEDDLSSSATRIVKERKINEPRPSAPVSWVSSTTSVSPRLSQVLADEVWKEELVPPEPQEVLNPVTLEEYEAKVAEIIEAENAELAETEAILNAPAFAESLEGFGDDDDDSSSGKLKAVNDTKTLVDDPLAALEMDVEDDIAQEEPSSLTTTQTYLSSLSMDNIEDDALVEIEGESEALLNGDGNDDDLDPTSGESPNNGDDSPDDDLPPDLNIIR